MTSNNPPGTLQSLVDHLNAIISNPAETELDVRLVETFTAQLTEDHLKPLVPSLAPLISATLFVLAQDPKSLVTLLLSLLSTTPFFELLPLATPETILQTLCSPSPPIQHLGLSLLDKATLAVSDAGIVASWTDVVKKLVELLLLSEDTGVSSAAENLLVGLLAVDLPRKNGTGLIWRRVLEDRGVYALFFKYCSWHGDALPGGKHAKTQGQGRLLGFVARIAELDFDAAVASRFPDVETRYSQSGGDPCRGFLDFAARHAIRAEEDVMMHMILLDFYTALLRTAGSTPVSSETPLDYLQATGLHDSTIGLYLSPVTYSPDPFDQGVLESKAADYISTFVSLHPTQLVSSMRPTPLTNPLLQRISHHLESYPPIPHAPSLRILSSLPTPLLRTSPIITKIPLSPPDAEHITALTSLFSDKHLYTSYISARPGFWNTLVTYASTLALKNVALACLGLIDKLTTMQWGLVEILDAQGVMTYLITPPRSAGGDPESTAYVLAVKKWEVLGAVESGLKRWEGEVAGAKGWEVVIGERRRLGIWGRGGARGESGVGAEVATLEM